MIKTSIRAKKRYWKGIQAMLANAILFDSNVVAERSKRMGETSAFVHIMYCPIISDGIKGFAKLYVVEEYGDTKKYYLTKIESEYLDSKGKDFPVSSSKYSDIHNVADLYALVKQYDKDFHPAIRGRFPDCPDSKV